MPTSVKDLSDWFDHGKDEGAGYMLVVCDTFDQEDYPVYCTISTFAQKYHESDGTNMQKIIEVYDLSLDKDMQMAERRAFHYPSNFKTTRRTE